MIDWTKIITPEDKFQQAKQDKMRAIEAAFNEHVAGSFVCSLGWPMQFDKSDSLLMEGAIQLIEIGGGTTGYITDAENVSHYDVPVADMRAVKIEMLANFAEAHAKKQLLRQQVQAATTQAELDAIEW